MVSTNGSRRGLEYGIGRLSIGQCFEVLCLLVSHVQSGPENTNYQLRSHGAEITQRL